MMKTVVSLLVASSLQAEDIAVDRVEFYSTLWSVAELQCPAEAAELDVVLNGYVDTMTADRAAGVFYDFDGSVYVVQWPLTDDLKDVMLFASLLQGLAGQFIATITYMETARESGVLDEDYYENLDQLDSWVNAAICMMPTRDQALSLPDAMDIEGVNEMLSIFECGKPFERMRQVTSLGREGIIPEAQIAALIDDVWTSCEENQ